MRLLPCLWMLVSVIVVSRASAQSPDVSRISMSYRHFLDAAPVDADPAPQLSANDHRLREEELDELQAIESLWA